MPRAAQNPERSPRVTAIAALINEQKAKPSRRRAEVVLHEVEILAEQVRTQGQEIDRLVIEARATGATWQQIGTALGVTPQTAHRRYSPDSLEAELERQNRLRAAARGELPLTGVARRKRQTKT